MGKDGKMMRKTMENMRGLWHKTMGQKWEKQWKIRVERLENWLKREEKRWKE